MHEIAQEARWRDKTVMPTNPTEGSYFIDAESAPEMARLIQLDMFMTRAMGGPLADLADPTRFKQILDLGCGPGGWALSVAHEYPKIEIAGIDISNTMIAYANARARSQGLNNASFEIMDVTQPLAFSDNTFDFINERLLNGSVRFALWPKVLKECYRISRPGGIMRMMEVDSGGVTNSGAFQDYSDILAQALKIAGYANFPDGRHSCVTPMLPKLLRDAGFQNIQIKPLVLDFSAGSEIHMALYRNNEIFFKVIQPFIVSLNVAKQDELDRIYQQLLLDMMQDDFLGMWYFLIAWGEKPL